MFAGRRRLRMAQGVVITGGREVSCNRAGWSVPKGELVSKLQALLHSGDLRIAASLPDATMLARDCRTSACALLRPAMPLSTRAKGRTTTLFWPWRWPCLAYPARTQWMPYGWSGPVKYLSRQVGQEHGQPQLGGIRRERNQGSPLTVYALPS